jgi:phospholipid-transporting ATPase
MRQFQVNLVNLRAPAGDKYVNNTIRTNKYTILTFLPLNLLV